MKQQIIVLGMHRSGTSTIAMILKELGVKMGEDTLGVSPNNPFGHEEDRAFFEINEAILKSANGSWDFPPKVQSIEMIISKHRKDIEDLIVDRNKRNDIWGWKEPRTTLLINYYSDYLSNPKYICVYRDSTKVALSLKKRNNMPIKKGIRLYNEYNAAMEEFLTKIETERVLKIVFDEVHSNNEELIKKIIEFIGIDVTVKNYKNALDVIKPINIVREKSKNLKLKDRKTKMVNKLRHPTKTIGDIYRRILRVLKYYCK